MMPVHEGVWSQLSVAIFLYEADDPDKKAVDGLFVFTFNQKEYQPLYKTTDEYYVFTKIDPGVYKLIVKNTQYMTAQPMNVTIYQQPMSDNSVLFVPLVPV